MIKNIVFAGTPDIAAQLLQDLLSKNINIIACYTQPDRPKGRNKKLTYSAVKDLALKYHLPVFQPNTLKNLDVVDNLQKLQPDLMIVFAYGLILPAEILAVPRYGCFNIHTSLLPKWRGAAPMQHAILAGDTITGINIIKMDAGLDTGDVYYSASCPIADTDTASSLGDKLQPLATTAILQVITNLNNNQNNPTPQNHALATYAHKITKADAKINWSLPTVHIDRIIRAFIPTPVAFSELNGMRIRIWQARLLSSEELTNRNLPAIPGKVLAISKHGIDVATTDGIIRLEKIQLPGGKILKVSELINSPKYLSLFNQEGILFT